jgi:hypothetical protein
MPYPPKPLCAVVSFAPMTDASRINRQLQWLKDSYQLVALGPPASLPGMTTLDTGLLPGTFSQKIWRANLLIARCYESFYCQTPHVQVTLAKLWPLWRLLVQPYMNYLCQRYLPQADDAITESLSGASD